MRAMMLLSLFLLFLPGIAASQDVHGRLEGRVVGSDGRPVATVSVTVRSPDMQGERQTTSDEQGFFTLRWLPVGTYSVQLQRLGYEARLLDSVSVRLGRTATLGEIRMAETPIEVEPLVATADRLLIDPESTSGGMNLTPQLYENLPVAREYSALTLMAPQAFEYQGTDLSISGGTGPETKFFIEGAEVTDPINGLEPTQLPYNFVREVEIKTGGYEAEYQSTLGGIVNVVTYSGGNEFQSKVFGFYTSDRLEGAPRYGASETAKLNSAQYDVGIALGGPIVRDRLWYFAAYNPTVAEEGIGIPELGTYNDRTERHIFAGKLTWQAGASSNVFLTAFGDPGTRDVVQPMAKSVASFTPLNPETWLGQEKTGSANLVVGASQVLGERGILEASLSLMNRRHEYWPTSEAGYQQQFHDHTRQEVSGGTTTYGSQRLERSGIRLRTTWELGAHLLKGGGELGWSSYDTDSFRHYVLRKYAEDDFAETDITRYGSLGNRIGGLFVQDSWQMSDQWRLNLGLRWELQELIDSNGDVAQTIPDQWQPRLGVIFQPGRIGTQRLYASAGRYFQDLLLNGAYHFDDGEDYGWTFWDHDPRVDPSGGEGGVEKATISPGNPGRLYGQHYDELTLGYERQLGERLKVGVSGTYRTLRKAVNGGTYIVAAKDPETGEYTWEYGQEFIGNPGYGILSQYPKAKRQYAALQLTAEQTVGTGLMLAGSYVLSRSYGNYQGLWDTDYWSPNPNASPQWYHPGLLENAEGLLPQDRTHALKLAVSYMTPVGLAAGTRFSWYSGTPISVRGGSDYRPMYTYLQDRGSNGRTPSVWGLDLRFVYDMRRALRRASPTRIVLDVFNVGSPRTALAYDDLYAFRRNSEGEQESLNPHYMAPTRYQAPMMMRLGLEVGF